MRRVLVCVVKWLPATRKWTTVTVQASSKPSECSLFARDIRASTRVVTAWQKPKALDILKCVVHIYVEAGKKSRAWNTESLHAPIYCSFVTRFSATLFAKRSIFVVVVVVARNV